jgi:hypothetical protein
MADIMIQPEIFDHTWQLIFNHHDDDPAPIQEGIPSTMPSLNGGRVRVLGRAGS